ncbi:MAG: hypothetical protein EPN45_19490 [Rhizobiaceae bacterium]|nr:MAG: hypothetical protein EPN45_19490 [Rhizobiaceae bacterium]
MKTPRDQERDPHSLVCRSWPDCQCDGVGCNPFGPDRPIPIFVIELVLLASIILLGCVALFWFSMWFWRSAT